jgi:hypothetical protein
MTIDIFIIAAVLAAPAIVAHYWKLLKDLRQAAKIFADRAGREDWWRVRLKSSYVDHEQERERQRQILESESRFIRYFVDRYGNSDDYDNESRTTGAPDAT